MANILSHSKRSKKIEPLPRSLSQPWRSKVFAKIRFEKKQGKRGEKKKWNQRVTSSTSDQNGTSKENFLFFTWNVPLQELKSEKLNVNLLQIIFGKHTQQNRKAGDGSFGEFAKVNLFSNTTP